MMPQPLVAVSRVVLGLSVLCLSCLVQATAGIDVWGSNDHAQLGDGTGSNRDLAVSVEHSGVLAGKRVTKVAFGGTHALALTDDGRVYAWGNNAQGQLGDGTTTNRTTPVAVAGLPNGLAITDISCGANSLAVDGNGQLWAWGDNSFGEIGDGTHVNRATPVHIAVMRVGGAPVALPLIAAVACGGSFNLALSQTGVVYAWGSGGAEGGLLGSGDALAEATQPIPVDRSGALAGKDVAKISAGVRHSLALTTDGSLVAWGRNFEGQIGVGSLPPYQTALAPVLVSGSGSLAGKQVAQCAAGYDFSIVLDTFGGLHAWGDNSNGGLGLGDTTNRDHPTAIATAGNPLAGRTITAIAAGLAHGLVLTADNALISWGANGSGQLGQGDFSAAKPTPALVIQPAIMTGRQIASLAASSSSNSSGVVTTPVPFVATTLAAANITATSALLNGSANSNEDYAATPAFEFGVTAACELGEVAASPSPLDSVAAAPISASLTGLQANSSYFFRAKATDAVTGAVVFGQPLMLTTVDPSQVPIVNPPQAPTVITLAATNISSSAALLHGQINPHGAAAGYFFRYRMQAANGSFGAWNQTFGLDVTGFATFSPAPNTTYQFQLEATNAGGTSTGGLLTFQTPAPVPPPTVVTGIADLIAPTTATLHGTVNPQSNETFTYFELGTDTTYGMISQGPTFPLSGNQDLPVAAAVDGLTPSTTYHFRLVATSLTGPVPGLDQHFTTSGPDLTPLVDWRLAQFGVNGILGDPADAADPDGDGISNLLEFAMGTDPKAFTAPPVLQIAGGSLVFPYQRNDAAAGVLSYQVEWWDGGNGIPWSSAGVVDNFLSDNGTIQQRQAVMPVGPNGMRMVRLRVTLLP